MRDLFGGREPGFLVGGGSRRGLNYRGRGREQRRRRMGRKRSAERERHRRRQREGVEGREYYGI